MECSNSEKSKVILGAITLLCILFKFLGNVYTNLADIIPAAYVALFISVGYYYAKAKTWRDYLNNVLSNFLTMLVPAFVLDFVTRYISVAYDQPKDFRIIFNDSINALWHCVEHSKDVNIVSADAFGIVICMFFAMTIYGLIEKLFANKVIKFLEFISCILCFCSGIFMFGKLITVPFDPGLILIIVGFMYFGKLIRNVAKESTLKSKIIASFIIVPIFTIIWYILIKLDLGLDIRTMECQSVIPGVICLVDGGTAFFVLSSVLILVKPLKNALNAVGEQFSWMLMFSIMFTPWIFKIYMKYEIFKDVIFVMLALMLIYSAASSAMMNMLVLKLTNHYENGDTEHFADNKHYKIIRYMLFGIVFTSLFFMTNNFYLLNRYLTFIITIIVFFFCALDVLVLFNDPNTKQLSICKLLLYIVIYVTNILFMSDAGCAQIEVSVFAIFMMMICSSDLSFYSIVCITFIITICGIFFTMLCSIAGIIPNSLEAWVKHTYGFIAANLFSIHVLMAMMEYFYLRAYGHHLKKKKLIILDAFVYVVGMTILWQMAKGRSSEMVSLIMIVGVIVWEFWNLLGKESPSSTTSTIGILSLILCSSFIVIELYSFLSSMSFNPDNPGILIAFIGKITDPESFKARLQLANRALTLYRANLFGMFFEEEPGSFELPLIDNAYIRMFFREGMIWNLIYIASNTVCLYRFWKNRKYVAVLLFTCIAIIGYMESAIINMYFCIFPLAVFANCDLKKYR